MSTSEQEIKLHVSNLGQVQARIEGLHAEIVQPRVHEINLRFDTPESKLSNAGQVLRLRQDTVSKITYKGPGRDDQGVLVRPEFEFQVNDFDSARAFLEALGYSVFMIYEKYRTTYDYRSAHITLDEMPYGDFLEIEADDPRLIRTINEELSLDWEARISESYTVLFDRLREMGDITFRDLLFENFKNANFDLSLLGIKIADTQF